MKNYLLPYFGQINLTSLEEDYYVEIELDGRKLKIDINFDKTSIDELEADNLKCFIENIGKFNQQNRKYIEYDYEDENRYPVKDYINAHVNLEPIAKLIDFNNKEITPEIQLLNKLTIERVGIYPDGKYETTDYAVFDYTIEGNVYKDARRTITDQLVVVKTDKNGVLNDLVTES
jgi:hypothetical protein